MKVEVDRQEDWAIVRPEGKLDALSAGNFQEHIDRILQDSQPRMLVDVSGVPYISSAGLRVLIKTAKALLPEHKLTVAGMTPTLKQVFDLAGFTHLMQLCDDVEEAIALVSNVNSEE